MTQVSIDNIHKAFGETKVLAGATAKINTGEFFFLVGPSGCGKTTLLRIIAGLEIPDSGNIFFDDKKVTATPVQERNIGFVFQNYCLWPHMTVAQNISFGLEIQGLTKYEQRKNLDEMLELVHLGGYGNRYPHELSGGQQQRVALARALALKPKVLLLDEPLSNLDAKLKESIREELSGLQRSLAITTIAVTHDKEDARYLASRVGIMDQGSITRIGLVDEVWAR